MMPRALPPSTAPKARGLPVRSNDRGPAVARWQSAIRSSPALAPFQIRMKPDACPRLLLSLLLTLLSLTGPALASEAVAPQSSSAPTLLLVVGAPGEPEFGTNFVQQAEAWTAAATRAGARLLTVGTADPEPGSAPTDDLARLRAQLDAESHSATGPLWLVLIGHGTFDNKEARFNLRGPDLTATELAEWLKPVQRPLLVVNTTSASAPFMAKLSATNRIVITATRSGNEQNFTRFGTYLAQAIASPDSDLDKDGQTSVLEAFLSAASRVAEFYKTEGRLATEHALIDDNGDGLGTPSDWFRGVRAVKKSQQAGAVDGWRAHQLSLVLSPEEQALSPELRSRRDALELEVFRLRDQKASLPEDDYYHRLEGLLLQLARLQSER